MDCTHTEDCSRGPPGPLDAAVKGTREALWCPWNRRHRDAPGCSYGVRPRQGGCQYDGKTWQRDEQEREVEQSVCYEQKQNRRGEGGEKQTVWAASAATWGHGDGLPVLPLRAVAGSVAWYQWPMSSPKAEWHPRSRLSPGSMLMAEDCAELALPSLAPHLAGAAWESWHLSNGVEVN